MRGRSGLDDIGVANHERSHWNWGAVARRMVLGTPEDQPPEQLPQPGNTRSPLPCLGSGERPPDGPGPAGRYGPAGPTARTPTPACRKAAWSAKPPAED